MFSNARINCLTNPMSVLFWPFVGPLAQEFWPFDSFDSGSPDLPGIETVRSASGHVGSLSFTSVT